MTADFLREAATLARDLGDHYRPVRSRVRQILPAVADWLDDMARLTEYGDTGGSLLIRPALAVARAVLGRES